LLCEALNPQATGDIWHIPTTCNTAALMSVHSTIEHKEKHKEHLKTKECINIDAIHISAATSKDA
jgi:hypothetical protein